MQKGKGGKGKGEEENVECEMGKREI